MNILLQRDVWHIKVAGDLALGVLFGTGHGRKRSLRHA